LRRAELLTSYKQKTGKKKDVPKCDKLAENCWICEKDLTLQKKQWALQSPKK
jgi:hypothetical protein